MCRNITGFYILILYTATLLNSFSSNSFVCLFVLDKCTPLQGFWEDGMRKGMCSAEPRARHGRNAQQILEHLEEVQFDSKLGNPDSLFSSSPGFNQRNSRPWSLVVEHVIWVFSVLFKFYLGWHPTHFWNQLSLQLTNSWCKNKNMINCSIQNWKSATEESPSQAGTFLWNSFL